MTTKYHVYVEFPFYDQDYDRFIEKIVGRECDGSGFGFGMRDISFGFARKQAALNAIKRVRSTKKGKRRGTKAYLYEDNYEE